MYHFCSAVVSRLEQVIGREHIERYERALESLRPHDRGAIVARVELGCSYAEVATMLGSPSANAARTVVERAIVRLVDRMRLEHADRPGKPAPDQS